MDFLNNFSSDLFNQSDIDLINEKVENNMAILLGNNNYMDIDDELEDLNFKLTNMLDDSQLKILEKFLYTKNRAKEYENCLAYYIGLQAGKNINKMK